MRRRAKSHKFAVDRYRVPSFGAMPLNGVRPGEVARLLHRLTAGAFAGS